MRNHRGSTVKLAASWLSSVFLGEHQILLVFLVFGRKQESAAGFAEELGLSETLFSKTEGSCIVTSLDVLGTHRLESFTDLHRSETE
jgi:hypothetical protein